MDLEFLKSVSELGLPIVLVLFMTFNGYRLFLKLFENNLLPPNLVQRVIEQQARQIELLTEQNSILRELVLLERKHYEN